MGLPISSSRSRTGPVLAAGYLTAGMLWALVQPGLTTTRVAFVALTLLVGWLGAAGASTGRPLLAVACGVVLFLLGFWQAVLWLVMLPVAGYLVFAGAMAVTKPEADATPRG